MCQSPYLESGDKSRTYIKGLLGALNEVTFVKYQMRYLALLNVLVFSGPLEAQQLVCYRMATSLPCLELREAAAANWTSWELSAITKLSDVPVPLPMRCAHTHPPRVCPKIRGVSRFKTDPGKSKYARWVD